MLKLILSHANKNNQFWLMPILLIALVLRVIGIESRNIWYDDAFSVFLSRQNLADIISGTAVDVAPPLYYFLLHYWMKLGQDVWVLRSLSIILSVAVLIIVYIWIRDLFSYKVGLLTALLIAVSPFQIYHAHELRMYSLLALVLSGYFYFLTRIWKQYDDENKRFNYLNWTGVVVCGSLALYTHNLAAFTLVAPNFFFLIKRLYHKLLLHLVLAQLIMLLLALPWLMILPAQIDGIQQAYWTLRPGLVEILQLFTTIHTNLPLPPILWQIALIVSLQLIIVIIIETYHVGRNDDKVLFIAIVIVLPAILLFVTSYLMQPIFLARAIIFSTLAYCALVSYIVIHARNRLVGVMVGLVIFLLSIIALPNHYSFAYFPRSPFQTASQFLQSSTFTGDVILHDNKFSYFPFHFYAPDLPQSYLPDKPGSQNDTLAPRTQEAMDIYPANDLESAVGENSRVWFVVFDQAIEQYKDAGYQDHPVLTWLDLYYDFQDSVEFNDLFIYIYVR
jgi:mannosyltransferase